ncbi:unnamed protein product [Gongylonema pulchrum]|uniref:Secreted protein n=1 Tax=Gongylonema pulchrum TaxID=637853 RepID=A0A183ET15_9BILA|nr:unnamed protein product [Gongylonema pulchrum]
MGRRNEAQLFAVLLASGLPGVLIVVKSSSIPESLKRQRQQQEQQQAGVVDAWMLSASLLYKAPFSCSSTTGFLPPSKYAFFFKRPLVQLFS